MENGWLKHGLALINYNLSLLTWHTMLNFYTPNVIIIRKKMRDNREFYGHICFYLAQSIFFIKTLHNVSS